MFQGHRLLWLGGLLPTAALMLPCSGDVALSSFDGKGEPGQINAVSHGCSPARFRQTNVLLTD